MTLSPISPRAHIELVEMRALTLRQAQGERKGFERDRAERAPDRIADHAHVRLHPAVGVEDAVVVLAVRAHGERDRAFDRLDDIGEADVRCRARKGEAACRTARARTAARRSQAGPSASAWSARALRSRPKARSR